MLKTLFKQFVELTGNQQASAMLQLITKSRASKVLIRPFARVYRLKQEEMKAPLSSYENLQELFTRRLKDGIRPIDQSENTIVSPVDGVINAMGNISSEQTFYIKERLYRLDEMLGSKEKAATYQDGYFFVAYLSPQHYHRIHYPVNGRLLKRWALGEKSFPVNSLGERWGNNPFSTNYRIITEAETEFGKAAIIKVGALNINSIRLTNASDVFQKGDEIGCFTFGSTVIVLLEHNPSFTPLAECGSEVLMGQTIGKWR